jgi:hypothetical protein
MLDYFKLMVLVLFHSLEDYFFVESSSILKRFEPHGISGIIKLYLAKMDHHLIIVNRSMQLHCPLCENMGYMNMPCLQSPS